MASRWLACIFQFPAIRSLRMEALQNLVGELAVVDRAAVRESGYTGQLDTLEHLETRSAARRHVTHFVVAAQHPDGGNTIATPDHAEPAAFGHRFGDTRSSVAERIPFEHSHRSVPE